MKLALLLLLQVWTPQRDCWTVYETCKRFDYQRTFNTYMTGPNVSLRIMVPYGEYFKIIEIKASDLWFDYSLDSDRDNDIDLRDYAMFQNQYGGTK